MHDPMPLGEQTDKKPRLLCVDDNVRFLEPFASLLQLCGYAVVTSDDPCAALPDCGLRHAAHEWD
jgi:CheY-like chemotaxis protein